MTGLQLTMPALKSAIHSTLESYFEYYLEAFGTDPPPTRPRSSAWSRLLDLLFDMERIDPDKTREGFFNMTIAAADGQSWSILQNGRYTVDKLTMDSSGYSPPQPGVAPSPVNSLHGKANFGGVTFDVQVPLDKSTSYVHGVGKMTIGDLLNAFGALVPSVGDAASRLPCPIAQTINLPIFDVNLGTAAEVRVDYGDVSSVSCNLTLNAVDLVRGGVLRGITIHVSDDEAKISLAFTYLGMPFNATFPYASFICLPEVPPLKDPNPPEMVELLKVAILVSVGVPDWTKLLHYSCDFFPKPVKPPSIEAITEELTAAARVTNTLPKLEELARSLWQVFAPELEDANAMAGALKSADLPDGSLPEVAKAMHVNVPSYTAAAVAGALATVYQASASAVAQALVPAWGFQGDKAGLTNLFEALAQGNVSKDAKTLATAAHQIFPDANSVGVSGALRTAFPPNGPNALTSSSLVQALASAGFDCRSAGQGLHASFGNEQCAPYVGDLMTAFANDRKPSASDIVLSCAEAEYGMVEVFHAMTDPPNSYFGVQAALAAIKDFFGSGHTMLALNDGSMTLSGYSFADSPFTIEIELLAQAGTVTLEQYSPPIGVQGFPAGYRFVCSDHDVHLMKSDVRDSQHYEGTAFAHSDESILDGAPHFVAVVQQGDGTLQMYKDAHPLQVSTFGTTLNGLWNRGVDVHLTGALSGGVLALRFWTQALSQEQLLRNLSQPVNPADTVGCWDFQYGTTADQSPLHRDGRLEGGAGFQILL
jgi:hypothetical protein